jgi:hypothetical protein
MRHPDEFRSHLELRDYVISTIRNTGLSASLKTTNPEEYKFFLSLFQRHPEKVKKEVSIIIDISIRRFPRASSRGPLSVQDHQFFIIKKNGTEDSISWNSCVQEEINPVGKRLNWAMRHAVKDEILEFKWANERKPCDLYRSFSNPTASYKDHKFQDLKDDFLRSYPQHPVVFGKSALGEEIFLEEDAGFRLYWQDHHRAYARLRILCKECNRKVGDYGTDQV